MKGLFSVLGLIAALFVSSSYADGSIYDIADGLPPDSDPKRLGSCDSNYGDDFSNSTLEDCSAHVKSLILSTPSAQDGWDVGPFYSVTGNYYGKESQTFYLTVYNVGGGKVLAGTWIHQTSVPNTSCPPKLNTSHTYEYDSNNDGVPDKCYNPVELDNLSQCALAANGGMLLPSNGSGNSNVCKTYSDGASCAFSLVQQGNALYYMPNLELSCFGGGDEIPPYDEPNPQPDMPDNNQCQPYTVGSVGGTTSYVCQADPQNYCSASGVCLDGCGYVNDQFVCFRDEECTGSSCEPAPVNCSTSPEAPICKDKESTPEPSFCEKNPMVAGCQQGSTFCEQNPTAPSCNIVGGGGGGVPAEKFVLDYDRLINGMKDAAKTLIDPQETPDFQTTQDKIDEANDAYQSKLDEFNDNSLFGTIEDAITGNIFGTVDNMLPSGGNCSAFVWWGQTLDFCYAAEKVRTLLYFVFAFLTFVYLRDLFFDTVTPRKE